MKPTSRQLDALLEMVNQGIDRGTRELNTLVSAPISFTGSSIQWLASRNLDHALEFTEEDLCFVSMAFNGSLEGFALLVFPLSESRQLVGHLTGHEGGLPTIDTLEAGTLCEVGNTILNGVMMSLGKGLDIHLVYQVPDFHQGDQDLVKHFGNKGDRVGVNLNTTFEIEDLQIPGGILLLLEQRSRTELLVKVDAMIRAGV